MKKMLKSQGVPEDQIDMLVGIIEKNPDLFKAVAIEVQAKMKEGKDQMTATMEVMQKHEEDLKNLI